MDAPHSLIKTKMTKLLRRDRGLALTAKMSLISINNIYWLS